MTFKEYRILENKAWRAFVGVFKEAGIDEDELVKALDAKDCFNDVGDATSSVIDFDSEEEE